MSLESISDQELVAKMLPESDNDLTEVELAWREFIRRYEKIIIHAIRKTAARMNKTYAINYEETADLMQKVLLKLSKDNYGALRNFKFTDSHSLKAYISVVAVTTTHDHVRAIESSYRIKDPLSIQQLMEHEDRNGVNQGASVLVDNRLRSPEDQLIDGERVEKIYSIVEGISGKTHRERNRRIFELTFLYGYTVDEIIEKEGIKVGQMGIYTIIHRIKKGLALKLSLSS